MKLERKSTGASGKTQAFLMKEAWLTPPSFSLPPALIEEVTPGATADILPHEKKKPRESQTSTLSSLDQASASSYPPEVL